MSRAERFFRRLLRLFPADFRGDFGDDMAATFEDQRRDVLAQGDRMGALRLWWDTIRGVVTKASYLGTQMEYEVETPAGNLFVVQYGSREPIPVGTDVGVSLTPERGVAIIPNA